MATMQPDVIDLSDHTSFADQWPPAVAVDRRCDARSSTSNVDASSAAPAGASEAAPRQPQGRKRLTEQEKAARDGAKRHKQEARQKAADEKLRAKQMQRTESQLKRVKQAVESKATAENYLTAIVHEAVLDTTTWFPGEEAGSIERRLNDCFASPAAASSATGGASQCGGARWRRATADDAPWVPHAGVAWQRKMPRLALAADGAILYDKILENECLLLVSADELCAICDDDANVALFGSRMAAKVTGKINKCTLLVTGLDKFGADRVNSKQPKESEAQLLSTLLALQMDFNIGHRLVKSAGELSTVIRQYHKAVAYGLHKERTQSKALYHLDGSVPKGTDYGSGSDADVTADWWHKMLMQVPKITESTASTISSAYATPWALVRAFDQRAAAAAAGDAAGLLSDMVVARGAGAALTQRRIGPAMANTIHTVMCAQSAHHVVT